MGISNSKKLLNGLGKFPYKFGVLIFTHICTGYSDPFQVLSVLLLILSELKYYPYLVSWVVVLHCDGVSLLKSPLMVQQKYNLCSFLLSWPMQCIIRICEILLTTSQAHCAMELNCQCCRWIPVMILLCSIVTCSDKWQSVSRALASLCQFAWIQDLTNLILHEKSRRHFRPNSWNHKLYFHQSKEKRLGQSACDLFASPDNGLNRIWILKSVRGPIYLHFEHQWGGMHKNYLCLVFPCSQYLVLKRLLI